MKRLLHFFLFKLMIDLLVTCLLGLRLFSKKWWSVHFSLKTRKVGKMEGWRLLRKSNLGLLLIFVFVNLRNTITQGIHKVKFKVKFKFHIYIYIYIYTYRYRYILHTLSRYVNVRLFSRFVKNKQQTFRGHFGSFFYARQYFHIFLLGYS